MSDDYQTDAEKAIKAQTLINDIEPSLYNQQVAELHDRAVSILDDLAVELERVDAD